MLKIGQGFWSQHLSRVSTLSEIHLRDHATAGRLSKGWFTPHFKDPLYHCSIGVLLARIASWNVANQLSSACCWIYISECVIAVIAKIDDEAFKMIILLDLGG